MKRGGHLSKTGTSLVCMLGAIVVLGAVMPYETAGANVRDSFNVNLYAFGRLHEGDRWTDEALQETVRLRPEDVAGARAFETAGWQNLHIRRSATHTITSEQGSRAHVEIISNRGGGPFHWGRGRNPDTFGIPNATLLDSRMNGTHDPGDRSLHAVLKITEIPFAAYDLVLYLSGGSAVRGDGRGTVRINGGHKRAFVVLGKEPDGTMQEISDSRVPGNYMVVRGLSGSSLHLDIRGDGFNHIGPAGFQIVAADRARPPLEVTDVQYNPSTREVTMTWRSFPGDRYGVYWIDETEGLPVFINPMVEAHPEADLTTYGPFVSPVENPRRDTFRVGLPDPYRPVLERVWGNNHTISLSFSKPIARQLALDPLNYVVTREDGSRVALAAAQFYPGRNTVRLRTAEPLGLSASYTVALHNLVDLSGYALEGETVRSFRTWDNNPDGVQVFILSGQSNMVGRGRRETGQDDVQGGIGSLRYFAIRHPDTFGRLLVDPSDPENSPWVERTDVRMWWNRAGLGASPNILKGPIGPVTTPTTFGPEYGFGWAVGDHIEQPVLLVKSAWGGMSLFRDFRPPRAAALRGGRVGAHFDELIAHVRQALDHLDTEFPDLAGMGYQIAGFGWHQGWNDSLDAGASAEYEANMADFIRDIRDAFGQPHLPISIAATGHGGFEQPPLRAALVEAQLAVGDPQRHPEFAGTVYSVDTRPFWRDVSVSPRDDSSHWNQNAESFFLIGYSMGRGMVQMLATERE